ncbi:MAG TPA: restriction endonuclease subunit S [Smithellaceae bacterium]|nr:restriction endonuclease subunit S [Smithellaceae bacterium]
MLDTDPTLWEQFETKKLGEICRTFLGATPKDASSDEDNGVAFLKTKNVYSDYLDLSDLDYITQQAHKARKSSALENGDILMTIIGASFEVIGRCLVYRDHPHPANINQNVIGIRIKDGVNLDPDFLCLQLNTLYGQMQVGQKAQRTAQFSLNKGLVDDFDVIIPQEKEQRRILERFTAIKLLRDGSAALSEEMLIAIKRKSGSEIDLAFANELGIDKFSSVKKEKVFLRKAANAERLDIPANHPDYTRLSSQIGEVDTSGRLSELVTISQESFNPNENIGSEINYIAIGDIDGITGAVRAPQHLAFDDLPAAARKMVRVGDVLVSSVRAGTERSVVFVAGKEHNGWVCTTGFHVLKPRKDVDPAYLGIMLKAPFTLFQQNSLQNRATYPTLSEDNLLSILVPVTNKEYRKKTLDTLSQLISMDQSAMEKINISIESSTQAYRLAVGNIFELLEDMKFEELKEKAEKARVEIVLVKEALQ